MAGHRLGALEAGAGGYLPPFQCIPGPGVQKLPKRCPVVRGKRASPQQQMPPLGHEASRALWVEGIPAKDLHLLGTLQVLTKWVAVFIWYTACLSAKNIYAYISSNTRPSPPLNRAKQHVALLVPIHGSKVGHHGLQIGHNHSPCCTLIGLAATQPLPHHGPQRRQGVAVYIPPACCIGATHWTSGDVPPDSGGSPSCVGQSGFLSPTVSGAQSGLVGTAPLGACIGATKEMGGNRTPALSEPPIGLHGRCCIERQSRLHAPCPSKEINRIGGYETRRQSGGVIIQPPPHWGHKALWMNGVLQTSCSPIGIPIVRVESKPMSLGVALPFSGATFRDLQPPPTLREIPKKAVAQCTISSTGSAAHNPCHLSEHDYSPKVDDPVLLGSAKPRACTGSEALRRARASPFRAIPGTSSDTTRDVPLSAFSTHTGQTALPFLYICKSFSVPFPCDKAGERGRGGWWCSLYACVLRRPTC